MPLNFANIVRAAAIARRRRRVQDLLCDGLADGQERICWSIEPDTGNIFSALTTATSFGSLCCPSHPGTASMAHCCSLAQTTLAAVLFVSKPSLMGQPPYSGSDDIADQSPSARPAFGPGVWSVSWRGSGFRRKSAGRYGSAPGSSACPWPCMKGLTGNRARDPAPGFSPPQRKPSTHPESQAGRNGAIGLIVELYNFPSLRLDLGLPIGSTPGFFLSCRSGLHSPRWACSFFEASGLFLSRPPRPSFSQETAPSHAAVAFGDLGFGDTVLHPPINP